MLGILALGSTLYLSAKNQGEKVKGQEEANPKRTGARYARTATPATVMVQPRPFQRPQPNQDAMRALVHVQPTPESERARRDRYYNSLPEGPAFIVDPRTIHGQNRNIDRHTIPTPIHPGLTRVGDASWARYYSKYDMIQ